MLQMHARSGDLLLTRAVRAPIAIEGVEMFNDERQGRFKKREGSEAETQDDAWLLATAADPKRLWLASTERIVCLDEEGRVLAEIPSQTFYRDVVVSRDFGTGREDQSRRKHDAVVRICRHRAVQA